MRQKSGFMVRTSEGGPEFDVLADVLRGVQLRSRVHARYDLTAPWGMKMTAAPNPLFYAVMRGNCVLTLDDADLPLTGGDFVFISPGRSFTLRDRRQTRAVPLADVYATRGLRCGGLLSYGGGGIETQIIIGSFAFDGSSLSPLASQLPALLHVKNGGTTPARWLESTLQFVAAEIEAKQPGYETTVSRLADVLFVQALRAHMASSSTENGWLRALVEPRLGIVLKHIHEKPEEPWTLEKLSRLAGMSRSVFAARFKLLVGEAPLTYVSRWRIHRAIQLMNGGAASMGEIARGVGYETESSFGKAFKRHMGMTPGELRRGAHKRTSSSDADSS